MKCDNIKGVDYDDDSNFVKSAPQIQIQNSSGVLESYYYLNDGYYQDKAKKEYYIPGWCTASGVIKDVIIPVGAGFWMKGTQTEITVTFSK